MVNTIRFRNPRGPGRPMFFLPLLQMWKSEWENSGLTRSNLIGSILLRVGSKPPDLAPRIQRALGAIDPNLTMLNVSPVSEQLGQLLAHEQLIGTLAQVFGVLALLLASVGLYGITAYSVARRTSEIGVRAALGATRAQVIRLILGGALAQAGMGIVVGIPVALASGRLLAGQLYGVKTSDPVILGLAAADAGRMRDGGRGHSGGTGKHCGPGAGVTRGSLKYAVSQIRLRTREPLARRPPRRVPPRPDPVLSRGNALSRDRREMPMARRATKSHEKWAHVSALPLPGPWPPAPVFQGSSPWPGRPPQATKNRRASARFHSLSPSPRFSGERSCRNTKPARWSQLLTGSSPPARHSARPDPCHPQ